MGKRKKPKKVIEMPPGVFDLDKAMKLTKKRYALGKPPWTEEELKKAYYSDSKYTEQQIQKLPGYEINNEIKNLNLSLEIFLDTVSELFGHIQKFRSESQKATFWQRPSQQQEEKILRSIRRTTFASAASAMALVDHSRKINKELLIDGYQEKIENEFRNNPEHRFVQHLRDYVCHYKAVKPGWQIKWTMESERSCNFIISQSEIKKWDGWGPLSKTYIKQNPEGIVVENLFKSYQKHVKDFHSWFQKQIEYKSESVLKEYKKYKRMIELFNIKPWLKVCLCEKLKKKIDPYKHLEKYLTKTEINMIQKIPKHSKKQVDRIIEYVDEWGAFDQELIKIAYKLFKVTK